MDLGLKGRCVIVTGGASNIGRATVLAFAGEGANIVVADLDEQQARKTATDAEAAGGGAVVVRTDVSSREAVEAMVKAALDAFGQIDVLVNNVAWANQGPLLVDKPDDEIGREIKLNMWTVVHCSRAVAKHMIDRQYGKIVNLGSDAGLAGQIGGVVYSGTKAGVVGMTRAMARELGRHGINVNCVCPGFVVPQSPEDAGEGSFWSGRVHDVWTPEYLQRQTKACAIRRLGDPRDIANMVVYLASDRASYVTGQTISVDGGMVMM